MQAHLRQDQFELLTKLYCKQPWLLDHEEALLQITKDCPDICHQLLISELLTRFTMLSHDDLEKIIESIIDNVLNKWNLVPAKTQFVATCKDYNSDGSQWLLDLIKTKCGIIGTRGFRFINKLGNCSKFVSERPNIILVDDFSGSGKTIINRVDVVRGIYKNKEVEFNNIYACVVGCMDAARDKIIKSGVDFYCGISLPKGIGGYYHDKKKRKAYSRMLKLESLIDNGKDKNIFPFGYGRAEALFTIMDRPNTPNSVFPIFWKPRYNDGETRKTILSRYEDDE